MRLLRTLKSTILKINRLNSRRKVPLMALGSADELTKVSSNKCFGGFQQVFSHQSQTTKCTMKFAIYLPPAASERKCPVVYWLSGLTCTEQNFITKAGSQRVASELGLIVVAPDTSPRNCNILGEDDSYDFGTGAGFYVDATVEPWSENYRMFTYVTQELPELVERHFPATAHRSIMGHSMGGHGALVCGLKCPERYRSVSAFAPICHPTACPWGQKALAGYLGSADSDAAKSYDAVELLRSATKEILPTPILVDQGTVDEFLQGQLNPGALQDACHKCNQSLTLRMHEGYDHSYYFIATFIEDHLRHHAKHLA